MGGGLMQLVAYGAQDIYLTGQPQITFFKSVYRRHTNFSMECIEQTLSGEAAHSQRVTVTVARNGDLLLGAHLRVRGPTFDAYPNYFDPRHMAGYNPLAFSLALISRLVVPRLTASIDWMKASYSLRRVMLLLVMVVLTTPSLSLCLPAPGRRVVMMA